MDLSGFAPPIQQLLGMIQTQSLFPGLSPLHPAFYQTSAASTPLQPSQVPAGGTTVGQGQISQETAAQILHQRLLATMCSAHVSSGSVLNLPSRGIGPISRNFTIDAILGNKENQGGIVVGAKGSSGSRQSRVDDLLVKDTTDPDAVSRYPRRTNSTGSDDMGHGSRVYPEEQQYSVIHKESFEERKRRFFIEKHYQQKCHQHTNKPFETGNFTMNSFQDQRAVGKNKRVRTIFTPEQLERLEAVFQKQQYMVGTERYYLAASLNLSEAQVKVWFQNRRIKWRKHQFEEQHQILQSQHRPLLEDEDENEASFSRSCDDSSHLCLDPGSGCVESKLVLDSRGEPSYGMHGIGKMLDVEADIQEEFATSAISTCVDKEEDHEKENINNHCLKSTLKDDVNSSTVECDTLNQMTNNNRSLSTETTQLSGRKSLDNNYGSTNNIQKLDYIYTGDSDNVLDFTMGSKQIW